MSHVNSDTSTILPDYNALFEGQQQHKFAPDRFQRLNGEELTKDWAERKGFSEPVVIPGDSKGGLGMVMPTDLTAKKVTDLVGEDTKVEVIGI